VYARDQNAFRLTALRCYGLVVARSLMRDATPADPEDGDPA
jgi:hypothetical protein